MSQMHNVALLSRGYGRRTKGYREVKTDSHYRDVGDEPLQIKLKFPGTVVVVCEKRAEGIRRIRTEHPKWTSSSWTTASSTVMWSRRSIS